MTQLAPLERQAIEQAALFGFDITPTGLRPVPNAPAPTFEQWQLMGAYLAFMERSIQWLIGDWLNWGEGAFSERASQAIDATGWKYETVQQVARVAQRVPRSRRVAGLSWSHHREVADLPAPDQDRWLRKARDEALPVKALSTALADERRKATGDTTCWLVVECKNPADRDRLTKQLEREGRTVKAS